MGNKTTARKNQWIKDNRDRVNLMIPKGFKSVIQEHALKQGESLNSFILRAIRETMKQDNKEAKL